MKAIASFFLKAKHGQIFLSLFIVPTVAEIATIPATIHSWHDIGTEDLVFLAASVLGFLSLRGLGRWGSSFVQAYVPN